MSGYVRQLENVSDQRILAIVQGSEENIALQKQIVEITERAQQLAASESQQVATRDLQANSAMTAARGQNSCGRISRYVTTRIWRCQARGH